MGTTFYPCGCLISRSMVGNHEVMQVCVCFKHSVDDGIQEAKKALAEVTDECMLLLDWEDPEVQAALVVLADAVRAICA